jgi:hypothetical protein
MRCSAEEAALAIEDDVPGDTNHDDQRDVEEVGDPPDDDRDD